MARMRTIKPEAATSESLAEVDRAVRWTFATFWTHADDAGRALANMRLIKSAIYPLDDDMTPDALAAEFKELERVGAVCFYTVEGREYVHVPAWSGHQHPNKPVASKLPPCPKEDHSRPMHVGRTENEGSTNVALLPVVVVGEGLAKASTGLVRGAGDVTAQTIVAEWIEHVPKRPPGNVIGQVAKHIGQLLDEGIDPNDIRRGVALWISKGLHPATLPSVVNEAMNSRPRVSRAQQETDDWIQRAAERMGAQL